MNKYNDKSVHVSTSVWYELSFEPKYYSHLLKNSSNFSTIRSCLINPVHISTLEDCATAGQDLSTDYEILNSVKPRSTRKLIDLTKTVCAVFFTQAEDFFQNQNRQGNRKFMSVQPPKMILISMRRAIKCCVGYQMNKELVQDFYDDAYTHEFVYSKANCIVTPLNISDVFEKKIKHIHVQTTDVGILWDQQSKLNPDTSLYVYSCTEDGWAYVKILEPDTDVVNENLCLINPEKTRHIPPQMAELFRQKTAQITHYTQSRNR